MHRTTVFLSDKQLERLKSMSEFNGVSVAEMVRRCIDAEYKIFVNHPEQAKNQPNIP